MTTERTAIGQEIETALGEVAAHVRGEAALPCRIVDDPAAERSSRSPQAAEAEPAEVRGSFRPRRAGRAGSGSRAAGFRTGLPACC